MRPINIFKKFITPLTLIIINKIQLDNVSFPFRYFILNYSRLVPLYLCPHGGTDLLAYNFRVQSLRLFHGSELQMVSLC